MPIIEEEGGDINLSADPKDAGSGRIIASIGGVEYASIDNAGNAHGVWAGGGAGSATDKLGLAPTAVKTANYSAAAGDFVPVDTTSGAVTVTLPTAPADGSVIGIKHVIQGGTNAVTYATGGSDVLNKAGGVTSATLQILAQSVVLQYKSSGAIWYVIAGDTPVGQLDLRYSRTGVGLMLAKNIASF